eukprot:4056068-Alexandrium_andersonii.AAC.1
MLLAEVDSSRHRLKAAGRMLLAGLESAVCHRPRRRQAKPGVRTAGWWRGRRWLLRSPKRIRP